MSTQNNAKGRRLERAVKIIQEAILKSSPEFKGMQFSIQTNVLDRSSGVLNEIDVLVKTNLGTPFETTWVFECKNWSKPVGKNEVFILAKKVEVLGAHRGYLVAKEITRDARAQIENEKRLEFIGCAEDFLSPLNGAELIHTAADLLPIVLRFKFRYLAIGMPIPGPDVRSIDCRVVGQPINLFDYIKWSIDELVQGNLEKYKESYHQGGVRWMTEGVEIYFSEREMTVNGLEVEKIMIEVTWFVHTQRRKILSKFEIDGRGQVFSFEPIPDLLEGKQLEVHLIQRFKNQSMPTREPVGKNVV